MAENAGRVVKSQGTPKNYFSARDPDTILFLQPSVSRRREATFWILGALWGNPFPSFLQNHRKGLSIIDVRELSRGFPGNGHRSVPRNLPSTRAGGQDDVSLNKLPQITYQSSMGDPPPTDR